MPRRALRSGALADPTPASVSAPEWARPLAEVEAEERAGRASPPPARAWGRRRPPVTADALPGARARAQALVQGQLWGRIVPAVRARALPVGRVVVLVGFRCDVAGALQEALPGDPDGLECLVLEREAEVPARLPRTAAHTLQGQLARQPRTGLSVLWVGAGRVELVPLPHVTDAALRGRRAS